ncbi:MAG: hypothetical protein JWO38_4341 [Gemmataceae bacterium]|nr:hypothetical protein [Gemmataceae bacterium]
MTRTVCGLLTVAVIAMSAPAARSADPADLLKYAPNQANAVVVINVEKILSSPRAVKEGWAKLDHTEFLAGAIPVNPHIERTVIFKEIHPHTPAGGPTFAVAATKHPVDIDQLVKLTGGEATTVGEEPAVLTPNKSLLIPLDKQLLGVAWSDNRQDVTRWVRAAKTATASPLARFLNATVRTIGMRHHVLIALDTEDLFDGEQAGVAVALTKALEGDREQAAAVQKFVAKLKGVVLTVDITTDGLAAALRFDSAATTVKVKPEAFKAFVLETLARNGATTEDLRAAAPEAAAGVVTLRFKLSDPELARIMGLFLPPLPALSSEGIPVAPAGVSPEATRKYVQAVNRILDELKQQNKRARDYEQTALWYDVAANRIETISVLNVDKAAVEYGLGTAARLRAIADSLRGVPVQISMVESKAYAVTYYRGGLIWSGRRPGIMAVPVQESNLPTIRQQEAEVIQRDRENREKLWAAIDQQRSEIRRVIAEKYKIDTESTKK